MLEQDKAGAVIRRKLVEGFSVEAFVVRWRIDTASSLLTSMDLLVGGINIPWSKSSYRWRR